MTERGSGGSELQREILSYYQTGTEADRLLRGSGRLEFTRTQSLLERYLPDPPAVILDVGGGSGIYACPLARQGYEVHLIDAVPLHVEQALQTSFEQPNQPLGSARVGDARTLEQDDCSVDVVLLFGPLYHLTEVSDRLLALREVRRVLREGGAVFAVGISRFASTLQGIARGFVNDPAFASIAERDLAEGQHRNPTEIEGYFTTAYFHHPEELGPELEVAGFVHERTVAIEGPAWMLQDIDEQWDDPDRRQRLLVVLRNLEQEPSLLGVSSHIMAIGRKQSK
ncbi:MAG: methyltransferase domain-containing protein [Candidatus Promineifilaceae bacterium]